MTLDAVEFIRRLFLHILRRASSKSSMVEFLANRNLLSSPRPRRAEAALKMPEAPRAASRRSQLKNTFILSVARK
jgi:hypothetical protein